MNVDILKLFLPGAVAFIIGIALTPFVSGFLYRNKMWKKKAGKIDFSGNATPIFNELHKNKEVGTPKMGGIVIWISAVLTVCLFWFLGHVSPNGLSHKFDFLSRSQTFIPLAVLVLGALVGLYDDYLEVTGSMERKAGGLSLRKRLVVVAVIGLACGMWFFAKLGVSGIGLPTLFHLGPTLPLGVFFPVFFMLVMMATYAGGVIDGIDGLAGRRAIGGSKEYPRSGAVRQKLEGTVAERVTERRIDLYRADCLCYAPEVDGLRGIDRAVVEQHIGA